MPLAPARPCPTPGCPYVRPCPVHAVKPWRSRGPALERIRGRKLQHMRGKLFTNEPFCRLCTAEGRERLATIRDHIVPLAEGGEDVESNTQPLCQECSDAKTARERARGTRRYHGGM